jgi:hypothetical protein
MTNDNKSARNLLASLAGPSASQTVANGSSLVPPPSPNTPPSPPNLFEQLFGRPVVQGLYYNGKAIKLDGYKFVGCRFDNCTLMTETGNFEVIDCVVDPSTSIQYGEQALKVVKLFNLHNQWMHANFPVFTPIKHSNGSVSIVGGP